jgi:hypothetical protein
VLHFLNDEHPIRNAEQIQKQKIVDRGLPAREIELFPDDLQHEGFYATLQSCLNLTTKCKKFVPPTSQKQRIAVLRPPGALGFVFDKFVQEVIRLHEHQASVLEVITTSHVPPYGYGKSHGYTKIIRLASLPLRLAVADLVREQASREEEIQLADVLQGTRQLVRWHCRLSHVAAHTALYTLTLENLLEDPWEQEYQLRVFLNLTTNGEDSKEDSHVDEDELAGSMDEIVRRATLLLMRLDRLLWHTHNKIEDLIDEAINDELAQTHNLHDWPCKSFYESLMSPVSKRIAQAFAPNCSSPFTSCFVPRDFCEEQGDVVCAKQQ